MPIADPIARAATISVAFSLDNFKETFLSPRAVLAAIVGAMSFRVMCTSCSFL
jgi:hypothetical protein